MASPGLFEVLAEHEASPPRCTLEEEYGAALLLDNDRVAANFVSTVDGIVSFGRDTDDSRAVGGGVPADRLLMAMLRAVAGVIVVGAGTLRATLNHQWTPQALVRERTHDLVELRALSGRPAEPAPLMVVTAGGDIPKDADAVAKPAVPVHVFRTDGPADAGAVVEAARRLSGGGPVLCEGGPHLFGTLLDGGIPIDLFLTVAPQLAGRTDSSRERRSLVEGVALPPFQRGATLRSVRRAHDHLLLRYRVDTAERA